MELKSSKALVLFVVVFLCGNAFGQKWMKVDSIFSPTGVVAESFSAPFFCDIDKDGDPDLFMGSSGNRVTFFENISYGTVQAFRQDTAVLSSIYANGYQFTNSAYPFLCDLDDDKDLDLMIGGYNGILYYKNIGDSLTPDWQKEDTTFADVNSQIGTDPKPVFVDIDGDGDLDLFVGIGESLLGGPTAGITIAFRNMGSVKSPYFVRDNTLTAGLSDAGYNAYPSFADLDKDGDYDMVMGRDLATFIHYKNVGNKTAPIWQTSTALFAGVEATRYWKDPMLYDYDNDGDFDLIYGTDSGLLYYYTNTGTQTNPAYTYDATKFKIIKSDNNAATVSFADYDKDGDADFICGNWLGTFQYYKNEGTKKSPSFKQTAMVFSGLDVGSYSTPVFVDIDKDGDQDIVSGDLNGLIQIFINNNNATFTKNTTMFSMINVASESAPALGDIDGDGDIDLLVCADNSANVRYYENTGGNVFKQNDTMFTGVTFSGGAHPTFADIDNDFDLDLIFGGNFGSVIIYENTGTVSKPVWTKNTALGVELDVKQGAACGFADLDGDTKPDAVVGEYDGTFTYFKNLFAPLGNDKQDKMQTKDFALMQNYPNPFNPSTTINYQLSNAGMVTLTVYDGLGREVAVLVKELQNSGMHSVTFSCGNLSSGVYYYTLRSGAQYQTNKMVVLK